MDETSSDYAPTHRPCGTRLILVPCDEPGCCEQSYCEECRVSPPMSEINFGDEDDDE